MCDLFYLFLVGRMSDARETDVGRVSDGYWAGVGRKPDAQRRVKGLIAREKHRSIFIRLGDFRGMTKNGTTLGTVLQHVARAPLRSSLFHWMYTHHDEIIQALAGRRIEWAPLCATFQTDGLTDATGKPPTERRTRETWYQVRREISKHQRRKAALGNAGQTERVRAPKDWMPPVIPQSPSQTGPTQLKVIGSSGVAPTSAAEERPASLLTKPKTPEQLIAEVALKKAARDRTPEEKIAVLIAGQQARSYS